MKNSFFSTARSRRLGAVAIAATAALTLAGCSGGGNSDGPTTIKFSYLWSGPEAEVLESIIEDFNDSQDAIVVKGVSSPDQQKQLTSMSSSNGSFDISDNFGENVGSWASKGVLAPLDEYIESASIDLDDFAPAALEQMKHDGQTYALPIAVHSFQLLYNKTLLDEAGVEPPTTMDELADAIEKLTITDDSGKITQLGIGDANTTTTLTTLGFAFGGAWSDDDGPTPTDPGNVEAVDWWQKNVVELVGADNLADFKAGEGQYLSAEDSFFSGKVAMIIDGEWRAASASEVAPDLDWGVTAIPAASPKLENSTQVTSSTLFIPTNSKHKDEAATFLSYLLSPEVMEKFSLTLGNLPARTSLLDSDAYKDLPNFEVWANALTSPNAQSLASAPYSAEYSTDLGNAFDDVVRGKSTAEKALDYVTSRTKSYTK
ncbi:ABC transporter substrate-binding protein [Paramicrobacterium agarici]|uniref:ABC transporter substrate-binding protein n=1 Tax=Paramicrobacterium agarici TaxID=630514 RepID=UPI00116DB986|nr:ABC transporter substrate-binding protein [Microbacterium agarici]TQO22958.1 carbohydrate ABC transporter substrate-binding protein (CUT1 family) [Microbacterium agarici]